MEQLKLHNQLHSDITIVSNYFIDHYMVDSNGEFVKIYLYLLRCTANTDAKISLSSIADTFNHTEKDVLRALKYWEKMELIKLKFEEHNTLSNIYFIDQNKTFNKTLDSFSVSKQESVAAMAIPSPDVLIETAASDMPGGEPDANANQTFDNEKKKRPSDRAIPQMDGQTARTAGADSRNSGDVSGSLTKAIDQQMTKTPPVTPKQKLTADQLKSFQDNEEVQQLLFIAEQYLGKTLTPSEIHTIIYFYDTLKFSTDLIEYLIEYCVSKSSKSIRYIETVALAWAGDGITTVLQAREHTSLHNKNYYTILNAFGIRNRNPAPPEINYMNTWLNEYSFTMDIILEACSRTIQQTYQPNFLYAHKILSKWNKSGVRHLSDLVALDEKHQKTKEANAKSGNNNAGANTSQGSYGQNRGKTGAGNKFNNFDQRNYDYDALERQLLSRNK